MLTSMKAPQWIAAGLAGCLLGLASSCSTAGARPESAVLPPLWSTSYSDTLEGAPQRSEIAALLPRYGDIDRRADPVLANADDVLVRGTIEEFGSPARASAIFSDRGVRYYLEDDYVRAMLRFNQAWLIDSTNPESYYGFAIVYTDHRNHAEAHRWIQEALNRNLSMGVSLADAALIEARYLANTEALPDAERAAVRSEIDKLLERARSQTTGEPREYVESRALEAMRLLGEP